MIYMTKRYSKRFAVFCILRHCLCKHHLFHQEKFMKLFEKIIQRHVTTICYTTELSIQPDMNPAGFAPAYVSLKRRMQSNFATDSYSEQIAFFGFSESGLLDPAHSRELPYSTSRRIGTPGIEHRISRFSLDNEENSAH